jgi:PLP dependent protein
MTTAVEVTANIERVRQRIADAGGDPDSVVLVGVTKGHPVDAARAALAAGMRDLGENYAQELVAKADELAGADVGATDGGPPPVRWHFIGRLQRNKVRLVAPFVSLWQSIDRLSVATEIAHRAAGASVLVQVNVTDEPQKGGCRPEFAPGVVEGCRDLGLDVRGLMTVGPEGDPAAARRAFATLARLADEVGVAERSMGMSGDLEAAVAEGSTMVRVGTAVFGSRPGAARVRD